MSTTDIVQSVANWLNHVGLVGLLVAILYGSYKRWWVWGHEIEKVERDRDEWRSIALSGTGILERATALLRTPSSLGGR